MSDRNRLIVEQQYHHLYKLLAPAEGAFVCFYCGELASTIDHVPPLSQVVTYRILRLRNELYFKVPACRECNTLLHNSLQETIDQRIDAVKHLLRIRYKKLLCGGRWTKQRVKKMEIKGGLRDFLLRSGIEYDLVNKRLNYNGGYTAYFKYLQDYEIDKVKVF